MPRLRHEFDRVINGIFWSPKSRRASFPADETSFLTIESVEISEEYRLVSWTLSFSKSRASWNPIIMANLIKFESWAANFSKTNFVRLIYTMMVGDSIVKCHNIMTIILFALTLRAESWSFSLQALNAWAS